MLLELRQEGTALLLATHDFEEADVLADRAVMMSHGKVAGVDTPDALRNGLGSWILSGMLNEHRIDGDRERYQTVWATSDGSVAAPTASLHFDTTVLQELEQKGVEMGYLTLHVGQGTFLPVETERVEDHPMHSEVFEVGATLGQKLQRTKEQGGRVIAAGTTVCRALEAWALGHRGATDLMILPGFRFQIVDGLLTNFHTPQSTLLALVGAMAQQLGAQDGLGLVKQVYAEAIAQEYRFFSYGDASLWI